MACSSPFADDKFAALAQRLLLSPTDEKEESFDDVISLLEIMISKEIRDFDYMDFAFQFYCGQFNSHFAPRKEYDGDSSLKELAPFVFWSLLIELPETDISRLASVVNIEALSHVFKCLSGASFMPPS